MQPVRLGAASLCLVCAALALVLVTSPAGAQTVLETPQQTNDRIRSLSTAASRSERIQPHDYVIGPGDLISVQVFDVPELSREVRVSQTGSIGLPLMPVRLHVAGLTESQAEIKIQEVLEANGLVSHPEVSVVVREQKSDPITIVGAVRSPMVYQAQRQVTLIEVLAQAGGISNDAGDTVIITRQEPDSADSSEPPPLGPEQASPVPAQAKPLRSNAPASSTPQAEASKPAPATGDSSSLSPPALPSPASIAAPSADSPNSPPAFPGNIITVNLNQLLETGDTSNNIVLQPGDIVTVPHAGIVYVLGAVGRPGGFVVSNDRLQLTTLKVLSLAGGLNRTAKSDRAVIVRKDSSGQQSEVPVDLKKVMQRRTEDVQLRPSDILYVPTSGVKTTLIKAAEIGLAVGTGVLIYRLVP